MIVRRSVRMRGSAPTAVRVGIAALVALASVGAVSPTAVSAAKPASDRWPSIAVDSTGHVHIAFVRTEGANPGLYYTTNASGAWGSTRITTRISERAPRLLVTSSGKVDIFWLRRDNTNGAAPGLYRATNRTGAWVATRLVATSLTHDIRGGFAVALDPSDRPHVVYDQAEGSVVVEHYLVNTSGSTFVARMAPPARTHDQPDLAIDADGKAWLTYVEPSCCPNDDVLWVTTNAGGPWTATKLPTAPRPIDPDVVVGSDGNLYVAYGESLLGTERTVVYTNRTGSWVDVDVSTSFLKGPDIGIRANGDIVVVGFDDDSDGGIKHDVVTASTTTEAVISGGVDPTMDFPTLALDATGASHVAFSVDRSDGSELRYLSDVGGTWATVIDDHVLIDTAGTFRADIEWLVAEGITSGCSRNLYCTTDPVTREQMAIFLDRALHLPATTTDYFTDDSGLTGEAAINRLAAAGITKGCTVGRYCAIGPVTRGEMASLLARALHLPTTTTDYFSDDTGTTHEAMINRVKAAGITSGCTPTTYCPTADVSRGEMAAFLRRALE